MSRLILSFFLFAATSAFAVDDEAVIKRMASTSSLTADEIRADYRTGCDSGEYLPMLTCSRFQYTAADMELNDIYRQLMGQLTTKSARTKLANAEKAWVKFRNATCDYETDGNEGRFWSVYNFGCLADVSKSRIVTLKKYLECKSPGCPGEW
jgi:uncharacterized protein YecT (DUF1311 family)